MNVWPGVPPTLMLAPEGLDTGPFSNCNRAFTKSTHSLGKLVCAWPLTQPTGMTGGRCKRPYL